MFIWAGSSRFRFKKTSMSRRQAGTSNEMSCGRTWRSGPNSGSGGASFAGCETRRKTGGCCQPGPSRGWPAGSTASTSRKRKRNWPPFGGASIAAARLGASHGQRKRFDGWAWNPQSAPAAARESTNQSRMSPGLFRRSAIRSSVLICGVPARRDPTAAAQGRRLLQIETAPDQDGRCIRRATEG